MVEYKIFKIVDFEEKNASFWKSSSTLEQNEIIHDISLTKPIKEYRVSVATVKSHLENNVPAMLKNVFLSFSCTSKLRS